VHTREEHIEALRAFVRDQGLQIFGEQAIEHGQQLTITDQSARVPVNFFTTGTISVQGKNSALKTKLQEWANLRRGSVSSGHPPENRRQADVTQSWIGVDESGKGDVFGPLVIAGVFVEDAHIDQLLRLGVRDSKTLSDAAILRLSTEIQRICPHHAILAVEPIEYNLLYERLQNLNRLLAQKHAEVISRLAAITPATRAVSDQFADERLIPEALAALDCRIALEQRPHAEDDIAVAAASMLARAEFVSWLERSSQTLGYALPPGVAQVTIDAGRRIVAQQGRKALAKFAKLHFRTVREMLR
jgi:ribonuclease HIII